MQQDRMQADQVGLVVAPWYTVAVQRGTETPTGGGTAFAPLAGWTLTQHVPADAATSDAWRAAVVEDIAAAVAWQDRQARAGQCGAAVRVTLQQHRPTAAGETTAGAVAAWAVDQDGAVIVQASATRNADRAARAAYDAMTELVGAWADAVAGRA